jgi:hypothetical protein
MNHSALHLEPLPREPRPLPRRAARLRSRRVAPPRGEALPSGQLPDVLRTALESLAFLLLLGSTMGTVWAVSLL